MAKNFSYISFGFNWFLYLSEFNLRNRQKFPNKNSLNIKYFTSSLGNENFQQSTLNNTYLLSNSSNYLCFRYKITYNFC